MKVERKWSIRAALAAATTITSIISAQAQSVADPRIADIQQAGKVRVGIGVAPIFAAKNSAIDPIKLKNMTGMGVDFALALASRMDVELEVVPYINPGQVLNGLDTNAWEIALQGKDPSRAERVDFTTSYMRVDLAYLVRPGFPIKTIKDIGRADLPKPRIAVPKGDIVDLQLTEKVEKGELRNVEIIRFVGSPYEVFGRVKNGEADICAQPATNFERYLQELPGARVLDGKFGDNFVALAIPKGMPERRQYLSEWIEAGKKNGLIQGMIGHSNLIGAYVSSPEPIK